MTLGIIWFILIFVLLAGYAVLDGFDLGVGALHLLVPRDDHERRLSLNSIAPVWDGNEVWLLTGGGALFAAFPPVYATVFSGFYTALTLLLMALIFRAVAIEFRSKVEHARWRRVWDVVFSIASLLPGVLLGVAFGNVVRGIPINSAGDFTGSFLSLLNPFSVVVGVLTLVSFVMHGAIYLALKTEGELRQRAVKWILPTWAVQVVVFVGVTWWAMQLNPLLYGHAAFSPTAWVLAAVLGGCFVGLPLFVARGGFAKAIFCSGLAIVSMIGLAAFGLFPTLVPSTLDPAFSLTIYNSSSTQLTLKVMLIIALIGMPAVLIYTAYIYRVFRGVVVLNEDSY